MASQKVTDLASAAVVALSDLVHIIDVSDTSGSPQGTSKKGSITQIKAAIGAPSAFTELSDTPAIYGPLDPGRVVQVNATGTGLEFADSSSTSIYTDNATIGSSRVATLTNNLTFTGGEVIIKGANDSAGSNALTIKNDSGDEILRLENDREIFLGTAAANRIRSSSGGGGRMIGGVGNSAATPAFGFYSGNGIDDGAGGNGWYRPVTANTQAWSTASTERMRLSSGGNFSIGTSVASARLHVKGIGATSATTSLKIENSTGVIMLQVSDDGAIIQRRDGASGTALILGSSATNITTFSKTSTTSHLFQMNSSGSPFIYFKNQYCTFADPGGIWYGVKIGGSVGTPDASAVLQLDVTDKGFLPPRMTTAQRAVINAGTGPAKGLLIYNTTTDQWEGNAGTPAAPNWVILG